MKCRVVGELRFDIVNLDGTKEVHRCPNTNSFTLRQRIAESLLTPRTQKIAFDSGSTTWTIRTYSANSPRTPNNMLLARNVGSPTKSTGLDTGGQGKVSMQTTSVSTANAIVIRSAEMRRGLTLVSLITGLSISINAGASVTMTWSWDFIGLTGITGPAYGNSLAATLASGIAGTDTRTFDFSDLQVQYCTGVRASPPSRSSNLWIDGGSGDPTRSGSTILFPTPEAVLDTVNTTWISWWRVIRDVNTVGTKDVMIAPHPENTSVPANARFVGSWKMEIQ